MAMMPRFELRQGQSQSLVMTPQLQQAIKLLQMSNLELTEYVEAELERNPLLEKSENLVEKRASDSVAADREPQPAADNAANSENGDAPDLAASLSDGSDAQSNVEQLDTGLENVYADEATADLASRQQASAPKLDGPQWAKAVRHRWAKISILRQRLAASAHWLST